MKENYIKIILLIIYLLRFTTQQGCKTNFDCDKTACCKDKECVSTSKCSRPNKITYVVVSIAGLIFVVLAAIYFYCEIKKVRRNVLELKKFDDKILQNARVSQLEELKEIGINPKASNNMQMSKISRIRK